jgi:hypothetical protein
MLGASIYRYTSGCLRNVGRSGAISNRGAATQSAYVVHQGGKPNYKLASATE